MTPAPQHRLFNTPDLPVFHHTIARCLDRTDAWTLRDTVVVVASRAAAEQLRWTLETRLLEPASAALLPHLLTRSELYDELHRRLAAPPRLLSAIERLVCGQAAAEAALAQGADPPFKLRPGLVAEFLQFYDELRRHGRSVEVFERLLVSELDPSAEYDRGARRLLRQTRFLGATFRIYEERLRGGGCADEHVLRAHAMARGLRRPLRHVVVTVGDRSAGSEGLWPADFDLLARVPGLERVDLVSTTALLDAGLRDRLAEQCPGVEELRVAPSAGGGPRRVAPSGDEPRRHFIWRDREEELLSVARQVKTRSADERTAVVFQRPLPYLYLASQVFGAAGVPYETRDTLPLAAEPYAAALDLVLACVASGYARRPLLELLRSPHFRFEHDGAALTAAAVGALDRALLEARYVGDVEALGRLATRWRAGRATAAAASAAGVVLTLARELAPLGAGGPASELLGCLLSFLERRRPPVPEDPDHESRAARARAAVVGLVRDLRDAHAQHDDPDVDLPWVTSILRRLVEGATFASPTGPRGVAFVDARAARYGTFDNVFLVGLVDGEWPERVRQSSLYPLSMLGRLGWPRELDRLRAARAAFDDLLRLGRSRVLVSTVAFEDDAVVTASSLLEDLDGEGEPVAEAPPTARVTIEAALAEVPDEVAVGGEVAGWLALRRARGIAIDQRRRGYIGPRRPGGYSVTALERYLDCPFKYFASSVLRLGEEPDDELIMTPRTRGRFVHDVFRRFFERWEADVGGPIDADRLGRARTLARAVAEELLTAVPASDRAVERTWLLGSPAGAGVVERLLRIEVDRPGRVRERLLEHRFDGTYVLEGGDGPREVRLRGTADRIDLLDGERIRVVDYKTGRVPHRARALQLPVYGRCAEQELARRDGGRWTLADAGYVAFGEPSAWVPLARSSFEEAVETGQQRCLEAVDGIERGEFPPRPAEPFRCRYCEYPTVCRKDYVGDE